ncbi:PAS domain S-box protein [Lysobacter humi (ex Lee et al. 2017)]
MVDGDAIFSALPRDSETVAMLLRTDWSATPLGPAETWPEALRVAVGICMNSRFPMFVWWGGELINVYNDAYTPILGARHPAAFGRPAQGTWQDIWDVVGPQARAVMERGEATWNERVLLVMERHGYTEQTWFTWSYSAIPDGRGGIGGLFCACTEETGRVQAERERDMLLEELEYERGQLAQAFEQSPALIALTRGATHVVEFANDRLLDLVGGRPILGLPARDAWPEAAAVHAILDDARASHEPIVARELPLPARREADGPTETRYVDFTFRARRGPHGEVTGVLAHGVDVTERRHSEARDRFFLRLDESVRALADPAAIIGTYTRAVAEHLQADRCAYADVDEAAGTFDLVGDHARGVPTIVGRYRLEDFGEHFARLTRAGAPYRIDDIEVSPLAPPNLEAYRRVGIRAVVSVPVMKGGQVVACMAVHQTAPRAWTDEDVDLLRQVASRCWDSLERARIERELRLSERRYRAALDATSSIVWSFSSTGEMQVPQPGWEAFTGQTFEASRGYGWVAALHPDDADAALAAWADAVAGEHALHQRQRLRRRDGAWRICDVRAVPVRDEDGQVLEWVGTHADVTERVEFERSLQESEARFRTMSDQAPVMVWVTRADGFCEYLNARWYEFTGQREAEAIGYGWLDAVHPDDAERSKATFVRANAAHEAFSFEYRLRRADGAWRWCVDSAVPRFDGEGTFLGFVGSVIDITERKRVEDALTSEKRVLELIATGSPLHDVLETLLLRLESQSTDGMLCSVLLLAEDGQSLLRGAAPSLPEPYRQASHGLPVGPGVGACGSAAYERRMVICADIAHDARWEGAQEIAAEHGLASCTSNPILGSDGRLLGTLALYYRTPRAPGSRDMELARLGTHLAGIVIEKHQLDERLRRSLESEQQARRVAERANRMKDEFLATLSHELRSPLNAILGWVSILRLRSGLPPEVVQGVDVIERNARAQAQIIEDLLDMSSIISGKISLERREVDVAALVHSAIETALPNAQARGLQLEARIDDDARVAVEGDPNRLQQVMWNLLSNAIKFTPNGGSVDVHVRRADGHLEIAVRDTGAGIDAAFLPHVFERFRQADASMSRRHGGLGLGLSIVRSLVELHHGTVRAESAGLGQGAAFVVALPLPVRARVEATRDDGRAGGRLRLDGLRVLVVDDDPDARTVTRWLLDEAGAAASAAADAQDALEQLAHAEFDVMVSDIGMPGVDGYELMRRVRAGVAQPDIPAVALTAYVRPQDRIRAREAGFHAHLAKPVDAQALVGLLAQWVRAAS